MKLHVLGIRHHGCGSAQSVCRALAEIKPDIVLIEGAPEANEILALAAHEEMRPPVAALIYAPDRPQNAVFYPFAEFSPEWQAIQFALREKIPVRFIDLPQSWQLVDVGQRSAVSGQSPEELQDEKNISETNENQKENDKSEIQIPKSKIKNDPLQFAAEAAGFSDGEIWWESLIETRENSLEIFAAVMDLMSALRAEAERENVALGESGHVFSETEKEEELREQRREAFMRQEIRRAKKEEFTNAVVVCGAWHAPVLNNLENEKADKELLKTPPKTKLEATWIPYTYGRLTFASGYGAGLDSPEFYHQLWTKPRNITTYWLSRVAALLREQDLDASSASVIEAVRLAESLAVMRGLSAVGLTELFDAVRTVFFFGDDTPLALIKEKLIVGERMGEVPTETPTVPLQKDLKAIQKRLRFAPDAAAKTVELDLRKPNDLEKSQLLHRLKLLGIEWGNQERAYGKGTFKENWRVQWKPEFEIGVIEASLYGNTVSGAASEFVRETTGKYNELAPLTAILQDVLLADLPAAIDFLMKRLQEISAVTSDVPQMMDAFVPLSGVLRYGNVRKTETASVEKITRGLIKRICIGLPNACSALNDEAAEAMFERIVKLDNAVAILQNEEYSTDFYEVLQKLTGQTNLHGLIGGRSTRILFEKNRLPVEEIETALNLAVSPAVAPDKAAAWVEGFLRGSGLVLLYNEKLLGILNAWVNSLGAEVFVQLLPILRRTFSSFDTPEKRKIGERLQGETTVNAAVFGKTSDFEIDIERADKVLPLVEKILGL